MVKYLLLISLGVFLITACGSEDLKNKEVPEEEIIEKDPDTGLIMDEGVNLVKAHCIGCHSSKLIMQNRASREGWESTIRWMQKTQNLWDLGENEEKILDYLAENYAPEEKGRRKPLENIEWYELEENE